VLMEPRLLVVFLLQVCLGSYVVGAAVSFALTRFPRAASLTGFAGAQIGGLAGLLASLTSLTQGASPAWTVFPAATPLVRFSVHLDPLAAFFTLVISLVGVAISIYSYGYVTHYYGVKNVGSLAGFFNLLLLATTLIFCADNAVYFSFRSAAASALRIFIILEHSFRCRNAPRPFFSSSRDLESRLGLFRCISGCLRPILLPPAIFQRSCPVSLLRPEFMGWSEYSLTF
jgi:hypothetical protein